MDCECNMIVSVGGWMHWNIWSCLKKVCGPQMRQGKFVEKWGQEGEEGKKAKKGIKQIKSLKFFFVSILELTLVSCSC